MWIHWIGIALPESVGTRGGINLRGRFISRRGRAILIDIALDVSGPLFAFGLQCLNNHRLFGTALPVSVYDWIPGGVVCALIVVRLCDLASIIGSDRSRLIVVTSNILVIATVVTGVEDGRVGFSIALTFYGYGYYDIRGGINLRGIWIGIALPESVGTSGGINLRGRPRVRGFFGLRGGISQSGE